MSVFDIDFRNLSKKLVPFFFRKVLFLDYLQSAFKGTKDVNDDLVELRDDIDFLLRWNAQVIYLEKYLNTKYDAILERIFITGVDNPKLFLRKKTEFTESVFLYKKSEGQPKRFLRTRSEVQGQIDYIVNIPVAITFDIDEITAQIKTYNVAGRRFSIVTF